jgi:hypothetical protein
MTSSDELAIFQFSIHWDEDSMLVYMRCIRKLRQHACIYEIYPQNKFHLQILPLQCCSHYSVHAYRDFLVPLEGMDAICRQLNQVLRIVLCVYNVQENQEAPHM